MAEKVQLCLKKLILDVAKLIKFDIRLLQLLKRHAKLLLNVTCY